jgi:hypothetical protein
MAVKYTVHALLGSAPQRRHMMLRLECEHGHAIELLDLNDAAKYVGLTPSGVKYHIYYAKDLSPKKIADVAVFTKSQLDAFMERKRPPGPRPQKGESE